jgi:hypothetical protein
MGLSLENTFQSLFIIDQCRTTKVAKIFHSSELYFDCCNTTLKNPSVSAAGSGVDLIDIHPSPSNVKAGSNFELLATVVNNSTDTIMLPAGRCDSPLTAFFMRNVVIRQDQFQGCTATSSTFELNQGEEVTVAGPVPGTIFQAIKAGETPATATVYYLTENGQPGNVTKPFVFTIN